MERITDQHKLKPWQGFALFTVLIALFLTVCSYMQKHLGMLGLLLTEVLFLALAVGFCLIRGVKIKEVFPIKKPKVRDIFGCLFLLMASQSFAMIASIMVGIIFPSWTKDATEISEFLFSGNAIISFLIVAISPAICEEAIHRGAILSCFRSIKKDWVIVLIMGVLFGINHMSPLKFLSTAILGAVLSYVVVKRNNMLLSMLIHFANNAYSTVLGLYAAKVSGNTDASAAFSLNTLAIYMILGFSAPVLLVLGCMLIDPKGHKKIRFLFAGIASAVLLISGVAILASGSINKPALECTLSYEITEEGRDSFLDLDIAEDGDYLVSVIISGSKSADYMINIEDENGDIVLEGELNQDSNIKTFTSNKTLSARKYRVNLLPQDNAIGDKAEFKVTVRKAGFGI